MREMVVVVTLSVCHSVLHQDFSKTANFSLLNGYQIES